MLGLSWLVWFHTSFPGRLVCDMGHLVANSLQWLSLSWFSKTCPHHLVLVYINPKIALDCEMLRPIDYYSTPANTQVSC